MEFRRVVENAGGGWGSFILSQMVWPKIYVCIDGGSCWLRLHGMPDGMDSFMFLTSNHLRYRVRCGGFVGVVHIGPNYMDYQKTPIYLVVLN
jgi:hypothetical protein